MLEGSARALVRLWVEIMSFPCLDQPYPTQKLAEQINAVACLKGFLLITDL